jgi:hypothetical protein
MRSLSALLPIALVVGGLGASAGTAWAQGYGYGYNYGYGSPPPEPQSTESEATDDGFAHHEGLLVGAGLGAQAYESRAVLLNTPVGQVGLALRADLGISFTDRFALLGNFTLSNDSETIQGTNVSVSHTEGALLLRYYIIPTLWVEGGIGRAQVDVTPANQPTLSPSGLALPVGVGLDVYHEPGGFTVTAVFSSAYETMPLSAITGENASTKVVPVALLCQAFWY